MPDWNRNIQRYRRYRLDQEPGLSLWRTVQSRIYVTTGSGQLTAALLGESGSQRYGTPTFVRPRLGQGSFQVAVVGSYGRRCAITGEKVLPVLEAAHIRPYGEGGEHSVDNGLLLRRDVHVLFDRGYITVTPDLEVNVSKRLRAEFDNGDHYLAMSGHQIRQPSNREDKPNPKLLDWHNQNRFVA